MESKKPFFTTSMAVLLGSVVIAGAIYLSGGISFDNIKGLKVVNPQITPGVMNQGTAQQESQGPITVAPQSADIKTFMQKKDAEICTEDGKPVIYLFSTTWCPHCEWISETFDKVANEYTAAGKIKAYHWEVDIKDNTLTKDRETEVPDKDMAVFKEFNSQGSIPTFVFGCKYFRVGNGYEQQSDLKAEEDEFRAVIDDLLK